jgi:hypothetical protein
MLGGMPILWKSKRQPIVSLSTTEAEYIQVTEGAKAAIWLIQLLEELEVLPEPTTVVYEDNAATIQLLTGSVSSQRSKHIDVRYHWLRERIAEGRFLVKHLASALQIADLTTKIQPRHLFLDMQAKVRGIWAEQGWFKDQI